MNKLLIITTIILLISISSVSALIIESTTANQNSYKDGDLITITIKTNVAGLDITADFSAIDSNFNAEMVIVEEEDMTYQISYPITFSNNKGDNTYNAIISLYDPITSTTNSVTYGILLANTEQRNEDTQEIILKIEKETTISIEPGYIQICKDNTCETITEEEYEASRQIIITNGKVTLSNLTYNQLRDEIQASADQQIKTELQKYLTEITNIKQMLEQNIYDLKQIILEQQNITNTTQQEANRILKAGNRNNIIIIIAVILLILAFTYTIYVRTETTWMSR